MRSSIYKTIASVIFVCLLLIGLDVQRTWQERPAELIRSNIGNANLARSLAQHAHDTFQAADAMLVGFRESLEIDSHSPEVLTQLQKVVVSQLQTVPIVRDLLAFDARGNCIVNSAMTSPRQFSIADRPHFQYHRDHPDRDLHVGRPIHSILDGAWILTLSRRVDDNDGYFQGVVVATITIDSLRRFYRTFDIGHDGAIGLTSIDGILIARNTGVDADIGKDVSGLPVFGKLLRQSSIGDWRWYSPIDGVERLGSYRLVEDYPLVVLVGLGLEEVLASWRTEGLFHFSITLCTDAIIVALGFLFVCRLRAQQRVELDLEGRERQYRLLAEHSTDLIIQLGPDLLHVYVSPASGPLLQYPPSALIGQHPRQLAHPDDWPALSAYLSTIAQSGRAPPVSYRAKRKDGTDIWVEAASRVLADGRGYVVVIRDIAERKEAETQLRRAQRMEAVGQLTAGVAHDFNNMLQAQLGALELLLDEVADRPKAAQFATMALAAGEHGAKLTHSLLSFSRQQVLKPEAVAIPALLARLERFLSRTLGPRILLQFDIEPGLAPVFADTAQLEAALLNLALNARDAMPEGGSLSIQACDVSTAPDTPESLTAGRHMLISVQDTGIGMSPEVMARACEPFFTTKGVGKGSGLGLSMVQGFARQSGGALRFRNAPIYGTRVELWLPLATTGRKAVPLLERPPVRGSGLILLVDDVPEVLLVLKELLQMAGFEVVPAASGEEALEMLAQHRFDALVTDFAMPGIDGGELAHLAHHSYPSLPVVIVTGYAEADKLGTVPPHVVILRKPVDGDVLARRICELLESTALDQRVVQTA